MRRDGVQLPSNGTRTCPRRKISNNKETGDRSAGAEEERERERERIVCQPTGESRRPLYSSAQWKYFLARESRGSLIRAHIDIPSNPSTVYHVGEGKRDMRNMTIAKDAKSNGCARHDNYVKLPPRISGRLLNFTLVPARVLSDSLVRPL